MEDKLDKKSPPASPSASDRPSRDGSQGGSAKKPHEESVSYSRPSKQGAIGSLADRMRGVFSNKTTAILAVIVLVVGVGAATLAVQRSTETRQRAATGNGNLSVSFTCTSGATKANLTWTDNGTGHPNPTYFLIYYKLSSSSSWVSAGNTPNLTRTVPVTGSLTANTNYDFKVVVVDTAEQPLIDPWAQQLILNSGSVCPTPDPTDTDGDGYSDSVETFIGTDPLRKCPAAPPTLGVPNSAWPPDLNGDNSVSTLDSDLFTPHFNCTSGSTCYDNRFDLDANGAISGSDVLRLNLAFGTTCQSPTAADTCTISGLIFVDSNNNGIQDGETGYTGGTNLTRTGGIVTNSDANGDYSFTNVSPNTYSITLSVPPDYTATTSNPASATVCPSATGVNFGIYPDPVPTDVLTPTPTTRPAVPPTATPIPGLAADINRDGSIDLLDFGLWLRAAQGVDIPDPISGYTANGKPYYPNIINDSAIDLLDFNAWLSAFRTQ